MAKHLVLAVLALCGFSVTSCEPVKYKDCGSAMSKLEEVDITPCPLHPCQLKRGTEETVEVTFIPKENVTKATTVVFGGIEGKFLPFPPDEPNACKDQGITCPMVAGKEYKFKTALPVKSYYPKIELVVKWEMTDQNSNMVYCWMVPVVIVD